MSELFASPFFGIALSIVAFSIGVWIQKKTGLVICNPLIIAIVLVSGVLILVIFVVAPQLLETLMSLQSSIPLFLGEVFKRAEELFASYPELTELYASWLPQRQWPYEEQKKLFRLIDEKTGG